LALVGWGAFIIFILLTRYVSLGSILGAATLPFSQYFLLGIGGIWEFVATLLFAIVSIARHAPNIKRLVKGQESRLGFKRKPK
jgi:glycerol-3-phosphate acyltransferase PlsY